MALRISSRDHEFLDEAAPGTPDYVPGLTHICSAKCRAEAHQKEESKWKEDLGMPCGICGHRFYGGPGIIIYEPGLKLSKPFMYICFDCTRIPAKRALFEAGFSQQNVCLVCGKDMRVPSPSAAPPPGSHRPSPLISHSASAPAVAKCPQGHGPLKIWNGIVHRLDMWLHGHSTGVERDASIPPEKDMNPNEKRVATCNPKTCVVCGTTCLKYKNENHKPDFDDVAQDCPRCSAQVCFRCLLKLPKHNSGSGRLCPACNKYGIFEYAGGRPEMRQEAARMAEEMFGK